MAYRVGAVFFCLLVTVSCASSKSPGASAGGTGINVTAASAAPPMDRNRKIAEQDCSKPVDLDRGNLRCKKN